MGYVDIKPSASPAKHFAGTSTAGLGSASITASQLESSSLRNAPANASPSDAVVSLPEQKSHLAKTSSIANADVRLERSESMTPIAKSDLHQSTIKTLPVSGSADSQSSLNPGGAQAGTSKASLAATQKKEDEPSKGPGAHHATTGTRTDESSIKVAPKITAAEPESRTQPKRANQTSSTIRQSKTEPTKDDSRSGKAAGRVVTASSTVERDPASRTSENRQGLTAGIAASNGGTGKASSTSAKVTQETLANFLKTDTATSKSVDLKAPGEQDVDRSETQEASGLQKGYPPKSPHDEETLLPKSADDIQKDKQQKRPNPVDETDRLNKRRKGDNEDKGGESLEIRGLDQRSIDKPRTMDQEKSGPEERNSEKAADKSLDRPKERVGERADRDHRGERPERSDKSRGEEHAGERTRDRSMERFRERSVDRTQDRGPDRNFERPGDRNKDERNKDDRNRSRYSESTAEKPHPDDRFPMQSLPPPPPLPPNVVPQSLPVGRREDEIDRRGTSSRPIQRLSPRREEKLEKRRSEEGSATTLDESKRRREDEYRKREEREISMKAEKDRDKVNLLKEEADATAASKRRRLKRDHLSSEATANYGPSPPPPLSLSATMPQPYDGRERDRKEPLLQRNLYLEESGYDKGSTGRIHNKEGGKVTRRDHEPIYNRDWEDDKRQRGEAKQRRHHRK